VKFDDGSHPATPRPVSGAQVDRTPVRPLRTTLLTREESLAPDGLVAPASTPPGTFALTGVVVDDHRAPVENADVSLVPSGGGQELRARTDEDGAFSFVDIPIERRRQRYDFAVTAGGFGAYRVLNDVYESGEAYVITSELSARSQIYDEAGHTSNQTGTRRAGSRVGYPSATRVPPMIRVAMYRHVDGCATGRYIERRRYPWAYYLLHVAVAEIDTRWGQRAWKANASAQQNYAWFHKIGGPKEWIHGGFVTNTTAYQCFKPHRRVPTVWSEWLPGVLDERIRRRVGGIQETQYRAGSYSCKEWLYRKNGNKLSQNGSRARANVNARGCGRHEGWRKIAQYYYTGKVVRGLPPKAPRHTWEVVRDGRLQFHFRSVGAWRYSVQRLFEECPGDTVGPCWEVIGNTRWSPEDREIQNTFAFDPEGRCFSYRVVSLNPAGASRPAYFGKGLALCP
jgi:Carboxypeptidase regulatory-like domain